MVHIGDFQIALAMTWSRTPYCPCSPYSTSTFSSPHLSRRVYLIISDDPSWGCVSGFENPDLMEVLQTELVHLDLIFLWTLESVSVLPPTPPPFLYFCLCFLPSYECPQFVCLTTFTQYSL